VILPEGDIEHPVKSILNLPVPTRSLQDLLDVGPKAGDEVPAFGLGFPFAGTGFGRGLLWLGDEALRFHKRHPLKTGSPALVDPAFSGDVDCRAATCLHPPVAGVHVPASTSVWPSSNLRSKRRLERRFTSARSPSRRLLGCFPGQVPFSMASTLSSTDRKKKDLLHRIGRVARVSGVLNLGESVNERSFEHRN
jgi:hypothetical protein